MQQEIKFRVFDKEMKTMHKVSSIDFESKEVFIYDKNGFDKNLSFDEIELMQFTGLTDKSGGEVYEGDVLDTSDGYGVIERSSYDGGWDVRFSDGCIIGISEIIKSLVVAGNVYKNPELLKK